MTVKNEAFIDLELALSKRIEAQWNRQWGPLSKKIIKSINAGDFDTAHDYVDKIDFAPIADKSGKMMKTVGMASVLLGASRVIDPEKAVVKKDPPKDQLANSIVQMDTVLRENATQALRRDAHQLVAKEEVRMEKLETIQDRITVRLQKAGKGYAGIASSLHVSRLSSFGFLMEAGLRGHQVYVVSEVLDGITCPICRTMHGKRFPVPEGLAHANNLLSMTDPEALRHAAPWPGQGKADVTRLQGMNQGQLMEGGLMLPPYHPNCRGIVTIEGKVPALNDMTAATIGAAAALLPESSKYSPANREQSGAELASSLYGVQLEIDGEGSGGFIAGAAGGILLEDIVAEDD